MSLQIPDPGLILLATVRILSALMLAPVFGHRSVPAITKIFLAAGLAWLLVSSGGISAGQPAGAVVSPQAPATVGLAGFLWEVAAETLLGLLLGFVISLVFWAVSMAGDLVALQMGWGFGGTIHASLEQSSGAMTQLYTAIAMLIFLGIGGHRMVLQAVADTFVAAPIYTFTIDGIQVERVIGMASALFTGALQIALPVAGTLMIVDIILAFLSRALPQLNAFVFGMPLKIGAGLLVLWMTLPALLLFLQRWLTGAAFNLQFVAR